MSVQTPDVSPDTHPEGSMASPEGSVASPEGSVASPEGSVASSEGSVASLSRHLPELWDDSSLLPGDLGMIETSPSQGIDKSIRMMILAIYHPKPFFKMRASGFSFWSPIAA